MTTSNPSELLVTDWLSSVIDVVAVGASCSVILSACKVAGAMMSENVRINCEEFILRVNDARTA